MCCVLCAVCCLLFVVRSVLFEICSSSVCWLLSDICGVFSSTLCWLCVMAGVVVADAIAAGGHMTPHSCVVDIIALGSGLF